MGTCRGNVHTFSWHSQSLCGRTAGPQREILTRLNRGYKPGKTSASVKQYVSFPTSQFNQNTYLEKWQ